MRHKNKKRVAIVLLSIVCGFFASISMAEDDASRMNSGMMNPGSRLRMVERIGGGAFKVLIYGNSIALHEPKPDIG